MIAFVIWEIGLPRIARAAEQRAEMVEENTIAILEWLDSNLLILWRMRMQSKATATTATNMKAKLLKTYCLGSTRWHHFTK